MGPKNAFDLPPFLGPDIERLHSRKVATGQMPQYFDRPQACGMERVASLGTATWTQEATALGGKHVIIRFQFIPAIDTGTQFWLKPGDGH